jgi:hypothetical protein
LGQFENERKVASNPFNGKLHRLLEGGQFLEGGWDLDSVFAKVTDAKVTELWEQAQAARDYLEEYSTTQFSESKEREPWLQKHVFIPLLQLLAHETSYRLHGNNIRLAHTHNSTYSTPDAMLTHKNQFAVNPKTGGTVFELEHTITSTNSKDKTDHFGNGRGQLVKYMIVEALAASRPLFTGVLTDCLSIRFYNFNGEAFGESKRFDLLMGNKPTNGFQLLVRLFNTPPEKLHVPTPQPELPDFVRFPHHKDLPTSPGDKRREPH